MELKKYYLMFIVLYLLALFLGGANRMRCPDTFLTKMLGVIWSLMPYQTAGSLLHFAISGVVLVILIILGFVAGCNLIAYVMRKEKDPREQ